ncbi:hypothetical protein EBT31_22620, partial [bacterium]|nr:hypothetical protein [bacterium]
MVYFYVPKQEVSMELHVYIWWVSEADLHLITQEMLDKLPEYIADEYRSRSGRNGRCRLWVHETFGTVEAKWSDDNPVCRLLSQVSAGGIVIS